MFKGFIWGKNAGHAVVAAGLVAGAIIAVAPAASAATNNWYVATTGTNTGRACTNAAKPCQTITYALAEQAASGQGGTIHVAAGTYTEQVVFANADSNVKLSGAGSTTIIQPPSSGLASDTDTDSSYPQYYVIDVTPGTTNVSIKNLAVSGLNGIGFLDTDGSGCGQDYVGVYYHSASGSMSKVSVTGIDLPADLFGCQGGQGIYVDGNSTVTINKASLLTPTVGTVTKASIPSGTFTNQILPVHSTSGYTSGAILVGGFSLSATLDGAHAFFVSGTLPETVGSGSTVTFNADTPAYDKNGITCDDNGATCTITNSTVQGEGPTNAIAQNGIQAFGSSAVMTGNTVSGNTYSGGGAGNSASGILLLNGDTFTVTGNTVSSNDVNIYAGDVPAYGLQAPTVGTWTISNNTVSGATDVGESSLENGYSEGIQLDSTTNTVNVQGNTVTTSHQGGILLTGVTGANIGGTGTLGNTAEGNEVGLILGGPGSAYSGSGGAGSPGFSSTGNSISGNTLSDNLGGALVQGAYAPAEFGGSVPGAAYSNTFQGNTWSENGAANVVDFSGFQTSPVTNQYGPSDPNSVAGLTDNSCDPSAGGSASFNSFTSTSGDFWAC